MGDGDLALKHLLWCTQERAQSRTLECVPSQLPWAWLVGIVTSVVGVSPVRFLSHLPPVSKVSS